MKNKMKYEMPDRNNFQEPFKYPYELELDQFKATDEAKLSKVEKLAAKH